MVSTIEHTLFETSQPTQTADSTATYEKTLDTHEATTYSIKQQLADLHRDYATYHEVLSREQLVNRYAPTLGPLTFDLGAQLLSQDSREALNFDAIEEGVSGTLHPPTLADIEFFGASRDTLLEVFDIQQQLCPTMAKEIKGKTIQLNNILSQAIEEVPTKNRRIIRDLRCALELAEEKGQSFTKSLAEIRSGETVSLSLEELDDAGKADKEVTIASYVRTVDIHFPLEYARQLQLQDTEKITVGDAVELAREIAKTDPQIADTAFAGLSEGLTPKSPHTALMIAEHISSPSLKAIRLSDVLRTSSEQLKPGKIASTRQEINSLFDEVVADPNPRQRVFAMAEIAANLGDSVTTRGVKQYIIYLTQGVHGDQLNVPVEAILAAIDNTNTLNEHTRMRRSFTRALANEMNKLHIQDDAERAKHQDKKIPEVPPERVQALAESRALRLRQEKSLRRRVGGALMSRLAHDKIPI